MRFQIIIEAHGSSSGGEKFSFTILENQFSCVQRTCHFVEFFLQLSDSFPASFFEVFKVTRFFQHTCHGHPKIYHR